jgi:UDP-N-acetylmuramate--alanine ligase
LIRARQLAITRKTRPEFLADLVSAYQTIAVAGTSGKSTVAGMLAFLMEKLGREPNFIGGGRVKQFMSLQNAGNYTTGDSRILIVEACESDGTIVHFRPDHTIITNLELDHHSIEKTGHMFEKLSDNTKGCVFLNSDDDHLVARMISNPVHFSIHSNSSYKAGNIQYYPFKTLFSMHDRQFKLYLPGRYNLYNAVACIAILMELGFDAERIADALSAFTGLERRFDIHLSNEKYLVIDDYAHNPHKIMNLLTSAQHLSDSICFIFQPHGYSPVRLLKDEFIQVFTEHLRESDHLILLPIYYAGGTVAKNISSATLANGVRASGRSVEVIEDRKMIFDMLHRWSDYVVFGARDDSLADLARDIADKLKLF